MNAIIPFSMSAWLAASAWAATNSSSVPTALELLDQYAATQAKFQSYYEKNLFTSVVRGATQMTSSEIWCDGRRVRRCSNSWGDVSPNLPEFTPQKPYHESKLWDGHLFFEWASGLPGRVQGILYISMKDLPPSSKPVPDSVSQLQQAEFLGRFLVDRDRVEVVLRQATNLQVRPRLERVRGVDCYVVEASTPYGRYTIWLDPQHGTNITQATVDRRAGNKFAFGIDNVLGPTERIHYELRNVRFAQVQGVWTPMEADSVEQREGASDAILNSTARNHLQRTRFILKPDHSAMRSFLPTDVPDGVEVKLLSADLNQADSLPRGLCVWQAGRVINKEGKVVLDCGLTKANPVNSTPGGRK